ncbi:hypothetical protein [Peribacillus sp. SCS-37]|uniref:hypothetical protein n=1 Tax=Paraperibacillus esterisolvens TaxID=3115296 RepID=UPI0039066817
MSEFKLPIALLLLSFFLKLYINREVNKPSVLSAIAELPVDVMFASMAFIISYSIKFSNAVAATAQSTSNLAEKMDLNASYITLFIYIIITTFVIAFWRTSSKKMDSQKWIQFTIFLGINYGICLWALVYAYSKLYEVM